MFCLRFWDNNSYSQFLSLNISLLRFLFEDTLVYLTGVQTDSPADSPVVVRVGRATLPPPRQFLAGSLGGAAPPPGGHFRALVAAHRASIASEAAAARASCCQTAARRAGSGLLVRPALVVGLFISLVWLPNNASLLHCVSAW